MTATLPVRSRARNVAPAISAHRLAIVAMVAVDGDAVRQLVSILFDGPLDRARRDARSLASEMRSGEVQVLDRDTNLLLYVVQAGETEVR